MKGKYILSIESSCDEAAAAVIYGSADRVALKAATTYSESQLFSQYGGVIPEVAARRHGETILPTIIATLRHAFPQIKSGQELKDGGKYIDYIAVTVGPGLSVSLRIGMEVAKILSCLWNKKLIAVNHLAGHLYANWLGKEAAKIKFPVLGLIVSGGHTELVYMKGYGTFRRVGYTIDDAAGEAFDKAARILGLGYPGGPIISKLAKRGQREAYAFPRPMLHSGDLQFSFSGLKTALLYTWRDIKNKNSQTIKNNLAASYEEAIVDTLIGKTTQALNKYKVKTLLLGGGVAANQHLRERLAKMVREEFPEILYVQPELNYTTDNAAMIGVAGYFKSKKKQFADWKILAVDPNWRL